MPRICAEKRRERLPLAQRLSTIAPHTPGDRPARRARRVWIMGITDKI